jgi:hypothetical protein
MKIDESALKCAYMLILYVLDPFSRTHKRPVYRVRPPARQRIPPGEAHFRGGLPYGRDNPVPVRRSLGEGGRVANIVGDDATSQSKSKERRSL